MITSEKLRGEADDLKARGDRIVASLLDDAADEIDRLRGALQRIAENVLPDAVTPGRPDLGVPPYEGSRRIAQNTLGAVEDHK